MSEAQALFVHVKTDETCFINLAFPSTTRGGTNYVNKKTYFLKSATCFSSLGIFMLRYVTNKQKINSKTIKQIHKWSCHFKMVEVGT